MAMHVYQPYTLTNDTGGYISSAFIVGDRGSLEKLRDAINYCLTQKLYGCVTAAVPAEDSDGDPYEVIVLRTTKARIEGLALPGDQPLRNGQRPDQLLLASR